MLNDESRQKRAESGVCVDRRREESLNGAPVHRRRGSSLVALGNEKGR